jgi:phosphoglycerate kinase
MSKIEAYNFSGKKAIVRVDFNVPFNKDFEITDDSRIKAALPTLKKIIKDGGSVIVMSHLGRPKGKANPDFSMKHVQGRLSELLGEKVIFAKDSVGPDAKEKAASIQPGQVLMLENLRFHLEEEGKPKVADDASEE